MTDREQSRRLAAVTDRLCHLLWLFQRQEPEVVALATSRGSLGFPHYLTSRLGVLPPERWAQAVFIAPESLVEHLLPRCLELDPPAYVGAGLAAAGAALRRLHPEPPALQLGELVERLVTAGELAAAWREWPRSGDPHQEAIQHAMALREERAYGHYRAARAAGLAPLPLLQLTAAFRGQPVDQVARNFKWSEEAAGQSRERLCQRGWLGRAGEITEAGRELRERLEVATDRYGFQPLEPFPGPWRASALEALSGLGSV